MPGCLCSTRRSFSFQPFHVAPRNVLTRQAYTSTKTYALYAGRVPSLNPQRLHSRGKFGRRPVYVEGRSLARAGEVAGLQLPGFRTIK